MKVAKQTAFSIAMLAICSPALACSLMPRAASKCLKEDVRFLSLQFASRPTLVENMNPEMSDDFGIEGPLHLTHHWFKTKGGTRLQLLEQRGSLIDISINEPRSSAESVLRLEAKPTYVQFHTITHSCRFWNGDFLQIGKDEMSPNGGISLSPKLSLVDEILADYWNKRIELQAAAEKIKKSPFPELADALEKMRPLTQSETAEIPIASLKLTGVIRAPKNSGLNEKQASDLKANFVISGDLILKIHKVCLKHENPEDDAPLN